VKLAERLRGGWTHVVNPHIHAGVIKVFPSGFTATLAISLMLENRHILIILINYLN
jgi:hypothetical protein